MYEEDRIRALDLYEQIFDEVGNETEMLQLLVSPTRQAVNLARAYDAKERSLQEDGDDTPAYVRVIEELRTQANTITPAAPKVSDDQFSLFEEPDVAETVLDNLHFDNMPEEDNAPYRMPDEISRFPDEDPSGAPASVSPPPVIAEAPAEEPNNRELDDFSDAVAAFLADFTLPDDVAGAEPASESAVPEANRSIPDSDWEPAPRQPVKTAEAPRQPRYEEPAPANKPHVPEAPIEPDRPAATKKKPNVLLLILFILLAVPVTLALIGLILIPAAIFLSFAALLICTGVSGLITAFTAFSVFADILLVFGLALASAGIGLLFFWIFVWLLASVIPDLIRSVCELARKLCYKEVAA